MLHARQDYMRIQDPENKIGEDEPVFLLRAKDLHAPYAVRSWAQAVAVTDRELANIAYDWADKMEKWQENNDAKLPDMPMDKSNITK